MNNLSVTATSAAKQHMSVATRTNASGPIAGDPNTVKELVWSSSNTEGWEILIYTRGDLWEACFFLWAIHHEHAISSSFASVKIRVEERIRILKKKKFKSAVWSE